MPKALMGPDDWAAFGLKMLPFSLPLARWGMVPASDYAQRFRDPFLRRAVPHMFAWPEIPMMAGISLLAYMHKGNASFPQGGSLEFARAIERRYLALGGQIHYNAQVEKILVEEDRAVGVRLYNDEIHLADVVISTADGRGTIFHMLDGEYTNRTIKKRYDEGRLPVRPQVQVSLGVDRDLSAEPHWITYLLDQPMVLAGEEHTIIGVKHYCFDPALAPVGKSVVIVMFPSNYDYWQRIYGRKIYDLEQIQICETIINFLETCYPGIRSQIEVKDVATPISYERYTGSWQGSSCGWLLTKETMMLMIQGIEKTLPGLCNFYMAGQWVEPGGSVPIVAMSGRNVIQMLCHKDGRPFMAEKV
jgi:phytoene dehydrogenase-like protein